MSHHNSLFFTGKMLLLTSLTCAALKIGLATKVTDTVLMKERQQLSLCPSPQLPSWKNFAELLRSLNCP